MSPTFSVNSNSYKTAILIIHKIINHVEATFPTVKKKNIKSPPPPSHEVAVQPPLSPYFPLLLWTQLL